MTFINFITYWTFAGLIGEHLLMDFAPRLLKFKIGYVPKVASTFHF